MSPPRAAQGSVKLAGQILGLTPFICEPRLPAGGPNAGPTGDSLAGQLTGLGGQSVAEGGLQLGGKQAQLASGQSYSVEFSSQEVAGAHGGSASGVGGTSGGGASAALANPAALGSGGALGASTAAAGGQTAASSGGPNSQAHHLGSDSRSALFFAVVSQKQARIYQVPASAASWSPTGSVGPNLQERERDKDRDRDRDKERDKDRDKDRAAHHRDGHHHHQHHHHHHHHHQTSQSSTGAHSPGSQLSESPLCKLLVNTKSNLVAECELSETSFVCHSQVVQWRSPDECCLVSYLASGNIVVHALPRLRPILMDADFVPYSSHTLAQSMRFSANGHCLYQPSQGEICKFTINSNYKTLLNDMLGNVYVPREMPEQPRANFFRSLFSVSQASRQSDRDELFGESSAGRASRNVAKHMGASGSGGVGGPGAQQMASTDKLKSAAIGTMGHEMRIAREGLDERGERLGELEDRTLNMLNQSESYSQAAHQLAQKFKDKKWYQF